MPSARWKCFAKVNLSLAVLHKRPDNFHEIRTVFQTISLADSLVAEWSPGRQTAIKIDCEPYIADNLVVRAADRVLEAMGKRGRLHLKLTKRIPMGGGLGGGSTDAAAVLMGLPSLIGKTLAGNKLEEIAASLGSDVPFFLRGGTALGVGRGEELYPLPDASSAHGLVIAPNVHVSTPDAYRALGRTELTSTASSSILNRLQELCWAFGSGVLRSEWAGLCDNDFEAVVFRQFPVLKSFKRKLKVLGAKPGLMTGSGAAVFGLFDSREAVSRAQSGLSGVKTWPFTLLSRNRYQAIWRERRKPLTGS